MDALHCMCVDVPSDYPAVGMTYYMCQKKMHTFHCVL